MVLHTEHTENGDFAGATLEEGKSVDVNEFHHLLGHCSESKAKSVASYYGVKLTGQFHPCDDCARAKARQANVPKSVPEEKKASAPGERLFFDVSSIKTKSFGGAKYWLLVVDDHTRVCFSYFLPAKNKVAATMVGLIKHLKKAYGYNVKHLRCDNAGENLATEGLCIQS